MSSGAGWRRLLLRVPPSEAPIASALLEHHTGAFSAVELGRREARVSVYLRAAQAQRAMPTIRRALARQRARQDLSDAELRVESLPDDAWATSWKRHYGPQRIAPGLLIVPSWRRIRVPRGVKALRLDPGMAFGTGQHPTTRLALQLLIGALRAQDDVIDVGTGSGILAIAAALKGARVWACDRDAESVAIARANFAANGVHAAEVRKASGIPASFPLADVVVANISARAIVTLAHQARRHLRCEGVFIVGGFSERSRALVSAALRSRQFALQEERRSGAWLAQVYRRR